jgi:hypothetical protein
MRDLYIEREVSTNVEEEHDDINEIDILGLTDDYIKFQVHNMEEMVCNVVRYKEDDEYSNNELAKYKRMIENSKKPLYHNCVAQYTRLFVMVKLFQLNAGNRWSDGSLNDLLTFIKDMLPQGNAVLETVYEAKIIICSLGLEVKKIHACNNECILYCGTEYEDLEK